MAASSGSWGSRPAFDLLGGFRLAGLEVDDGERAVPSAVRRGRRWREIVLPPGAALSNSISAFFSSTCAKSTRVARGLHQRDRRRPARSQSGLFEFDQFGGGACIVRRS
jgi:hypothetical protein